MADPRRLVVIIDVVDPEFARLKTTADAPPKQSAAADRDSGDVRSSIAPDRRRHRTPEREDPASQCQDEPR